MAKSKEPQDGGTILVAVDFGEDSLDALAWASRLADWSGWGLRILHVVHDPQSAPGYYHKGKKRKGYLRRLEDAASQMMDEFMTRAVREIPDLKSVAWSSELVVGLPVGRILELAERYGVRMIVMGSRGRTGLPHVLLGSKAERVVQLSPVPVTIVKTPRGQG